MSQGEIGSEIKEAARGDEIGAVGKAVEGIKIMVARKAAEEAEVKRLADAAAAAERRRTMVELAGWLRASRWRQSSAPFRRLPLSYRRRPAP